MRRSYGYPLFPDEIHAVWQHCYTLSADCLQIQQKPLSETCAGLMGTHYFQMKYMHFSSTATPSQQTACRYSRNPCQRHAQVLWVPTISRWNTCSLAALLHPLSRLPADTAETPVRDMRRSYGYPLLPDEIHAVWQHCYTLSADCLQKESVGGARAGMHVHRTWASASCTILKHVAWQVIYFVYEESFFVLCLWEKRLITNLDVVISTWCMS